MLTKEQVKKIREHLDNAQNPLFFFDNDSDGLCGFLLLQRYAGKGKGVPIKSFPELTGDYIRKVMELKTDYIFILDKAIVSREFFNEVEKLNIPVVMIDHHIIDRNEIPDFVNYYNPVFNSSKNKGAEPTTFLCYQVSQRKEDIWIAVAGCISDRFIPDFYKKFKEDYNDLSVDSENAFDVYYKSKIGKIVRIFGFALKDRTSNVISMIKFLMKVKTPYDVLEENKKNQTMHDRFNEINKKYKKFLEKAVKSFDKSEKVLFFKYGGDLSISSDLSNELIYRFPEKTIIVAYDKGIKFNISARGKGVRKTVLKAIENIEGARGGGHEEAVGATIPGKDLEEFKDNIIGYQQ